MNDVMKLALLVLASFSTGIIVAALFTAPAGYVSYTIEVPSSRISVEPFYVDLGALNPATSGSAETSFVITIEGSQPQTLTFRAVNTSTIAQTFLSFIL